MEKTSLTYSKDKRAPIEKIYSALSKLKKKEWIETNLYLQKFKFNSKNIVLKIPTFITKKNGPSLWIISGIHGEEPAGPNAIIKNIKLLNRLSKEIPIVLLPLCNPKGYFLNWRYTNTKKGGLKEVTKSVGDCEHLLPSDKNTKKPFLKKPTCKESDKITKFILKNYQKYPPLLVLDFHEDEKIKGAYVYSQGILKEKDPIARQIVNILRKKKFEIIHKGKTRFNQTIQNGIVSNVRDGSIDEFLASKEIIYKEKKEKGPNAKSAVVIETSSMKIPLKKRVEAHSAILRTSKNFFNIAKKLKN